MNGDYSIFNNSMNGVITLSDGFSFIENGSASHQNISYENYLKSANEQTMLTNDSLTTVDISCNSLTTTNISANAETLGTLTVTNINADNYGFYVDGFGNTISSSLPFTMNNTLKIVGHDLTLENGSLQQIGTTSTNALKSTNINGTLTCQSDINQTGGNTVLQNVTSGNITMSTGKSIVQAGSTSNSFGNTTVSNLVVTTSMTFPSTVTIPAATQTDDLTFIDGARIIQDLTEAGANYNTFMYSKLAKIDVDGNITQQSGNTTLLNTTVQGTTQLQGDITQTAGQCVLKAIGCDQLSLNANKDLFFSNGTGRIDQSVSSGTNMLNTITMNANRNLTQSGTGILLQSGTGTNALKSSSITGTLAVSSSTTLTGNVDVGGSLNIAANRSITQAVGTTNNQLQTTTISNLTCPTATVTNLTATSLSVGNVSNAEIQFLDGVTGNIQTQINSINSTANTVNTNTTGISYTPATDTTTIDNNVAISTGKTLLVGSTDVGANIASLNTQVSSLNTQATTLNSNTTGITYASVGDTTTIDNNVTISTGKTLIVGGMDIKAEIDALDTSFTTGTINSTTATISTLSNTNLTSTNITTSNITVNTLLTAAAATIANLTSTALTASNITVNTLLTAAAATIANVTATALTTTNATINTLLTASAATITNLTATNLTASTSNTSLQIVDSLQPKFILPYPLETRTFVKTILRADVDKPMMSPNTYVGVWMVDAVLTSNTLFDKQYPIMCSMRLSGSRDDLWIVAPGYRVVLYRYANYAILAGDTSWSGTDDETRQTRTLENLTGTTLLVRPSIEIYGATNQVASCKVFYQSTELSYPYFSYLP